MDFGKICYGEDFKAKQNKTKQSKRAPELSIKYWQEGQKELLTLAIFMNDGKRFCPSYKQILR